MLQHRLVNSYQRLMPRWAWTLLLRHFKGQHSRPAVRWMNRFAFLGLLIGVFSWTTVLSIMNGLQGDRKDRVLKEKPHLLWEASPRSGLSQIEPELRNLLGEKTLSIRLLLQTEGLLEVPSQKQAGRITGSGVIIQGVPSPASGGAALGDSSLMGQAVQNENRIKSGELWLGAELMMNVLNLSPGEEVKLHNVWRMELTPLDLRVAGAFDTGVYEIDRGVIRVNKEELEQWLGLKDAISRIEIKLKDPFEAPQYLKLLEEKTKLPFKSWQETEASLFYSLKLEMIVITVALFFVVLIAAFAVHLALSVRIVDKTREIGLLRALGADDRILSRLYLFEGVVLGVCGSLSGLMLSYFFCLALPKIFSQPDIYYNTTLPVHWSWPLNILLALCAVFLSVFASWWPAQNVRNVQIQEALRA